MTDRSDRLVALLDALGSTVPASTSDVDLVTGVLARLQPRSPARRRRSRRRAWTLFAVGVSVALLTGCVAIPAVRTAVLDLLHLNGLVVRQEPLPSASASPSTSPTGLPSATPSGPGRIGTRTTLAAAEAATDGRVLVPAALGEPAEVWQQGPLVDLVYRDGAGQPTWVVTEVTAPSRPILEKILGMNAGAELVHVGADQAVWITGPQELVYVGGSEPQVVDSQLPAASLIWEHGGVTVRIQAVQPKDTVVRVAESMR